jgi:hypothetical protein
MKPFTREKKKPSPLIAGLNEDGDRLLGSTAPVCKHDALQIVPGIERNKQPLGVGDDHSGELNEALGVLDAVDRSKGFRPEIETGGQGVKIHGGRQL